jgi:hypothetical protein
VAPPPNSADQSSRRAADIPHGVSSLSFPSRQFDAGDTPLPAHPMREPAGRDPAAPPMTRPAESVAPARVPTPPPLVPTATHFVPSPAFAPLPPAGAARPADAHRRSNDGEATEVHVSIGRIELTAVQDASPPARRTAPVKPSLPLHEYLSRRQGRPS